VRINVTVIGKAFYDVDHARAGKNDRGGKTPTAVGDSSGDAGVGWGC
jgi:hypothetical protein